jgi:prepilin-type N-terminal cleavage/methylation domain-containing protein
LRGSREAALDNQRAPENKGWARRKMNAMTGIRRPARGFSMVELVIVVAITLVVAAIAVPQILQATQNFKLRSSASGLSGIIQKARMLAVARNGFYPVLTTTSGGATVAFIDMNGSGTMNTTAENTNIFLPDNVVLDPMGSHPSDTTVLNGLTAVYSLPRFNPRGLPCFVASGVCNADPARMYITFLRQDRPVGGPGWAAINVTPAGRVQVWTWDGSKWN